MTSARRMVVLMAVIFSGCTELLPEGDVADAAVAEDMAAAKDGASQDVMSISDLAMGDTATISQDIAMLDLSPAMSDGPAPDGPMAPPLFSAAAPVTVGTNPNFVVAADLNCDGKTDLAVANYKDGNVSILLGNGNGTFKPAVNYPADTNSAAIAIGDFNRDGSPDLAVANAGANNVSILLGNGKGLFASPVQYQTGKGPITISTSDLNSDGKLDLMLGCQGGHEVDVLLGNGDGTFGAAAVSSTASVAGPLSITVGDFNRDGRLDVATANNSPNDGHEVSVLLGNGNGGFLPAVTYGPDKSAASIALGDLDRDGIPDLVIGHRTGGISVLIGKGDGTFPTLRPASAGNDHESLQVVDIDLDGRLDVVTVNSNFTSTEVLVLAGKGDGTLGTAGSFTAEKSPISIAAGDLNGDGTPDLAVANNNGNTVTILLNQTPPIQNTAFAPQKTYAAGAKPVTVNVADLNRDGKLDLIATDSVNGQLAVLLGNGDGTFGLSKGYPAIADLGFSVIADFNGDGILDAAAGRGEVAVVIGKGDGSFGPPMNYGSGITFGYTVAFDLNRDGKIDLASADSNSNNMIVLLGKGDGTFVVKAKYPTGPNPQSIGLADFNCDGIEDVVTGNVDGPSVSMLLGDGAGGFQAPVPYATSDAYSLAVGDFNRDGRSDVIVAAANSTLQLLLGKGDGTLMPATNMPLPASAGFVVAADWNLDGRLDVVATAGANLVVLPGKGDGTFGAAVSLPSTAPNWLTIGDFDRDGRPDIARANYIAPNLSVFLNLSK